MILKISILLLIVFSLSGCQNTDINTESRPIFSPTVIALIDDLGNENANISKDAEKKLLKLKEEAYEPLLEALNDQNPLIRGHAAYTLGLLGNEKAVEPLSLLLEDENVNVRLWSIYSLGILKDKSAVNALILYLKNENEIVRVYSARALNSIGDKKAIEALEKALEEEKNPLVINVLTNILEGKKDIELINSN